jgi:hypothetical protein
MRPNDTLSTTKLFPSKDTQRLKCKGWKVIFQADGHLKQVGGAVLTK